MNLRTANRHRKRRQLWEWWRPRFDRGDFNAFLMSLRWRDRPQRYFRTPKDPTFHEPAFSTTLERGRG